MLQRGGGSVSAESAEKVQYTEPYASLAPWARRGGAAHKKQDEMKSVRRPRTAIQLLGAHHRPLPSCGRSVRGAQPYAREYTVRPLPPKISISRHINHITHQSARCPAHLLFFPATSRPSASRPGARPRRRPPLIQIAPLNTHAQCSAFSPPPPDRRVPSCAPSASRPPAPARAPPIFDLASIPPSTSAPRARARPRALALTRWPWPPRGPPAGRYTSCRGSRRRR